MFHVHAVAAAIATHARGRREGQTLVEYGLLLTLIALVVMAVLVLLGPIVNLFFSNTGDAIS